MIHLKEFATQADYEAFVESGEMEKPNVVLVNKPRGVFYHEYEPPIGVFIQHINGTLYTTDKWTAKGFSAEDANGVAVCTKEASFVVAKVKLDRVKWSDWGLVDGVAVYRTGADADLQGLANTEAFVAQKSEGAAVDAYNYIFPDGKTRGYLPAYGELRKVNNQLQEVKAAMELLGVTDILNGAGLWSSTQSDAGTAWSASYGGMWSASSKTSTLYVWPFGVL